MRAVPALILGLVLTTARLAAAAAPVGNPAKPSLYPSLADSGPFQRSWWALKQRAYPLGEIPEGARLRALHAIQMSRARLSIAAPVSGVTWTPVGPAPLNGGQIGDVTNVRSVSGRVADIAIDPSDSNHWLIGAAQGGIWETLDGGATWTPKTDGEASLAMGAVAFAPSDPSIVYAGTGEASFAGDSYAGAGLLKSIDGGNNWTLVSASTFAKRSFSDIRVDPSNALIVIVATTRGHAGRGGESPPSPPSRGILKSNDGGANWSLNLSGEATDLEVDPTNFSNQYCGIGDPFGSGSNGIYRSVNGGDTWISISGPWTSLPAGVGRVELAIAPSNPNVLYVSIQDAFNGNGTDGGLLGLWKTTNAWDATPSWTTISVTATDDGTGGHGYCGWDRAFNQASDQCWYDHEIIVDPSDANILYAGGIPLWRFNGNTSTWTEVSHHTSNQTSGIHADQHTMAWAGSRLIVGNDGGVWSTTNAGGTWSDHNTNLATTQFYDGSLHATNPNFALGGSQDDGTERWNGADAWRLVNGGDGADNAIAASDPDNNWAVSSQGLKIRRTTTGGVYFTQQDGGIDKTGAPFIARFEKCPANDDIFIAGTDNLWKTTNFFSATNATWSANGPEMAEDLSAMAFAPSDTSCNTYIFGTASGKLRRTADGSTFSNIDASNAVPNRYVTDVAFDPTNANVLYVTLSGFDEGTPGQPGHLFKTSNALGPSPSWSNVSPPVNIPHNTIAIDPSDTNSVYVGTDLGVWKSTDAGATWTQMGPVTGMPNVAVLDLQINDSTDRLVAFTHGRSAFRLGTPLPTPTATPTPIPCASTPIAGCTSPGKSTLLIKDKLPAGPSDGDKLIWKWLKGPAFGQAAFGNPLSGSNGYNLCVYDGTGRVIQLNVPGGGTCNSKPCWKALGTTGYTYANKSATVEGVFKITEKGGNAGKSKIVMKAKNTNLPVPPLPLNESVPITVQFLRNDTNSPCWEATFSSSLHSDSGIYQAKTP